MNVVHFVHFVFQLFHKIKDTGDAYCKKDDVITNIDDDNILLEYLKHPKNMQ